MINKAFRTLFILFLGVYGTAQAALTEPTELVVTPEHRQATGLIVHLMSNYHYLKSDLGDELSQKILAQFIDNLDPNRMIFLASDVKGFGIYSTRFDDYLRVGYIKPAFDVFSVFRHRVRERARTAKLMLDAGVDFTVDETYQYRREDAAWPTTEEEVADLWRKRVKRRWLQSRRAKRLARAAESDTSSVPGPGFAEHSERTHHLRPRAPRGPIPSHDPRTNSAAENGDIPL